MTKREIGWAVLWTIVGIFVCCGDRIFLGGGL